jgi:hypothetical protein
MTASNDWLRATRRRVARGLRGGRRASTLAHARLALLARIGELNEMDLDTATRLDALLDAMLPDIADACAIFLIDGGQLHLTGARHVDAGREPALSDPALRGPFDLRSSHPTARAVRSHQPVLDTPSSDRQGALLRSLRIGSLLTVPLVRRE